MCFFVFVFGHWTFKILLKRFKVIVKNGKGSYARKDKFQETTFEEHFLELLAFYKCVVSILAHNANVECGFSLMNVQWTKANWT